MAVDPADCRRQLTGLARRDHFLNQADQRPLLESMLAAMDATVKEALEQAGRQLHETGQQLDDELAETAGPLHRGAHPLARRPGARPARQGSATDRSQRPPPRRHSADPGGRLVETLQGKLPEELVLVLDRQQQHQTAGRSIWQIEGPRVLDQACNGHGFLVSRLLYLRLRQRHPRTG